jgi:hypothetical protein
MTGKPLMRSSKEATVPSSVQLPVNLIPLRGLKNVPIKSKSTGETLNPGKSKAGFIERKGALEQKVPGDLEDKVNFDTTNTMNRIGESHEY